MKHLKNNHISEREARFCRYALPILNADQDLPHEIKGFGMSVSIEPCVEGSVHLKGRVRTLEK